MNSLSVLARKSFWTTQRRHLSDAHARLDQPRPEGGECAPHLQAPEAGAGPIQSGSRYVVSRSPPCSTSAARSGLGWHRGEDRHPRYVGGCSRD